MVKVFWQIAFCFTAPSVNQVFTLDFESNPLYVDADFSLKTNIQPVEVVYDEVSGRFSSVACWVNISADDILEVQSNLS